MSHTMPTVRLKSTLIAAGLVIGSLLLTKAVVGGEKPRSQSAGSATAEQMMIRAHKARAAWKDFPGFTAEIVTTRDGKRVAGKLTVTADFDVKLSLPDKEEAAWAERSLSSVVSHRRSTEGRKYNVEFADDVKHHPLGRLIKLNEDLMGSVYRIKGDVITEVHRKMKTSRFTITVTEVTRNKDGKYLPRSYSFSTWDRKTGNLKSNTTVHDSWKRVGSFDLPKRMVWVRTADDGQREVRQIVLRKHRLTGGTTAAK